MRLDVTSRRGRSFVSSASMIASVCTASDETASARAILNIQRRQIESTLSSYSTEALRASLKLPRLVASESRIDGFPFSYERIENICRHEGQQNPCPQSSVALASARPAIPHRLLACFFIFIVILSSSLSYENTAQVHKLKLLSIYKINKNIENR